MRLLLLLCLLSVGRTQTLDQAKAFLLQWEGCSFHAVHRRTETVVGIGHKVRRDEMLQASYTQQDVDERFADDYGWAMRAARQAVADFDGMPYNARLILFDIAFNCGPAGLMKFNALRYALNMRLWSNAAYELANSRRSRQVSEARAMAEFKLLNDLSRFRLTVQP